MTAAYLFDDKHNEMKVINIINIIKIIRNFSTVHHNIVLLNWVCYIPDSVPAIRDTKKYRDYEVLRCCIGLGMRSRLLVLDIKR